MRHERRRFGCIALASLLVCAALVGPVGSAAGQADERPAAYSIVQGDRCVPLEVVGDGSQTVTAYYDYRNGSDSDFSSHGTDERQATSVSQLYVYRGAEGDSLVVLHDARNDGGGGGAVSMAVTGIPASAEWVVEDDSYPGNEDRFNHSETRSRIDWVWFPSRTDGGVLRGLAALDGGGITIDARWGEQSYGGRELDWEYANNTLEWRARTTDSEFVSLSKDQPVTLRAGDCSAGEDLNAALDGPANATRHDRVRFDASDSTVPDGGATYYWDFDSDGDVGDVTREPTAETVFRSTGEHEVTVTVADSQGRTDTATVTVNVGGGSDTDPTLTARLDAPNATEPWETVRLDASDSTGDEQALYYWDLDGDGRTEDVTWHPRARTRFYATGQQTVSVTIETEQGGSATAEATVNVTENDHGWG